MNRGSMGDSAEDCSVRGLRVGVSTILTRFVEVELVFAGIAGVLLSLNNGFFEFGAEKVFLRFL